MCLWCGAPRGAESLDHLWPRGHRLRDNDPRALVSCCMACNARRKRLSVRLWLRALRERGVDVRAVIARVRRCCRSALLFDAPNPTQAPPDPVGEDMRAYVGADGALY